MARKIRKEDTVRVIYGRDQGKTGKVTKVIAKKGLLLVAGINRVTKHSNSRQGATQSGIIKKEAPIPISSVAFVDPNDGNHWGRVGWNTLKDGGRERFIRNAKRN